MKEIKNVSKKIIVLALILCMISIYFPAISFAENNTEKPGLDVDSINISNKNVTVGEKVKISFRINNISGEVKYVDAYYTKPIVNILTDKISFKYNIQNGLFESEFEITDTWINGEYLFNRLMISVGDYGETYYNSENDYINNYGPIINLNSFNFNVYGTNGDDTPPVIVSSSVDISNDRAVIGDTITYKAKVLENTTIKTVNIKLANQTGRYEYSYKTLNMVYNPSSQLYEAKLVIDESLLAGYWHVYSVYAKDGFNNYFTLYNTQFFGSGTFTSNKGYANLAKACFKNFQEYPDAKLEDEGIVVENSNLTTGDDLKISMLIRDDFKIDNVKVYYNQESGNKQIVLYPEFENIKYTLASSYGGVQYCVFTTDKYCINKKIYKYGCNSNWIVARIEVENMAGHITTFYNKQVYPYSLTDLSSGNFSTYGLVENLPFPDVDPNEWYIDYVEYAYNNELITGYTQGPNTGCFCPNDNITRAQIITILWRHAGKPESDFEMNFTDITNSEEYYYKAVKWAQENGIVTGYLNGPNAGKFLPDENITREQLALILQRYATYCGKDSTTQGNISKFPDAKKVSDWALAGMKWAVGVGIISGQGNGNLDPLGTATRAEAATMIMRFCENVIK